jgi:hypothetical protein
MNLRESIKKHLILEKRIGQISTNFEITFGFDVITTTHSNYRGGGRDYLENYNQTPVSNAEIVEFVHQFKKDIAEKIVYGEILENVPFVIISEDWQLAMAVSAEKVSNTYWKLIIITLFRESELYQFKIGMDQVVIKK